MARESSPVAVVGIIGVRLLVSSGSQRPVVRVSRAEKCGTNTPSNMLSLPYRSHDTIMRRMIFSMYDMSLEVNARRET